MKILQVVEGFLLLVFLPASSRAFVQLSSPSLFVQLLSPSFVANSRALDTGRSRNRAACGDNESFLISQVSRRNANQFHLSSSNNNNEDLEKTFGGYTVKQRLREEVESPFRTVRLFFFGSSTGSALTALYFSLLSAMKAYAGGFSDAAVPLEEALQSCGINSVAAVVCGWLTYRDWQAGNANLARIAKGGALAKLIVIPAAKERLAVTLSDFRRKSRVLIAAGGRQYIEELCRSLNADQLMDENTIAAGLLASDVLVVPVLLEQGGLSVGDTRAVWADTTTPTENRDRNFDLTRSESVVAFPRGTSQWAEYLKDEVETAQKQGFDVLGKGFTITVKKNGKILRRATGQPPWAEFLGAMEVLDASKFGMPGDDEKYYNS